MRTLLENQLRFDQTALNLRATRQQVLASNIANADTPNFKARDFDFRTALSGALGGRMGPLALASTSPLHLAGSATDRVERHLQYRTEQQGSIDGNTVNMDVERSAFAENAIHYEASVNFINGLLRSMQTAISGQ